MIQRIQTLYFLLSIGLCIGLLYVPMGAVNLEEQLRYYVYGFTSIASGEVLIHAYLSEVVIMLVIFLQLLAILTFKNRNRQAMLGQISLVLLVVLMVSILMSPDLFQLLPAVEGDAGQLEFNWNIILVIIPWILTYLAIRGIKKDEALVRSADRMR